MEQDPSNGTSPDQGHQGRSHRHSAVARIAIGGLIAAFGTWLLGGGIALVLWDGATQLLMLGAALAASGLLIARGFEAGPWLFAGIMVAVGAGLSSGATDRSPGHGVLVVLCIALLGWLFAAATARLCPRRLFSRVPRDFDSRWPLGKARSSAARSVRIAGLVALAFASAGLQAGSHPGSQPSDAVSAAAAATRTSPAAPQIESVREKTPFARKS